MDHNTILTKEYLINEFIIKGLTKKQIASNCNCNLSTIGNKLRKLNIRKNKSSVRELTGRRFFHWLVLERTLQNRSNNVVWKCKCDCGKVVDVIAGNLLRGISKSCGCKSRHRLGKENKCWKGFEEISGRYWNIIINNAIKRKIVFDVNIEYIWNLFLKQNRRCYLSNVNIIFSTRPQEQTASLDRIDSSKGYIEGNVQWVHKEINEMKWDSDQNRFIEWCIAVANNRSHTT